MKNNYLGKVAKDKAAEVKKLKEEIVELKATFEVIVEMISDATYHGERSFSVYMNYIEQLAKSKIGGPES